MADNTLLKLILNSLMLLLAQAARAGFASVGRDFVFLHLPLDAIAPWREVWQTEAIAVKLIAIIAVKRIAIEGGASFDPAAAEPVPKAYWGRTKHTLTPDEHWNVLHEMLAAYQRDHPQSAPIDPADEPEQQPIVEVLATKPTHRRAKAPARTLTSAELLSRIYAAEGCADRLDQGNANKRQQAAAIRRKVKKLRAQYDALQSADAAPEPIAPRVPSLEE